MLLLRGMFIFASESLTCVLTRYRNVVVNLTTASISYVAIPRIRCVSDAKIDDSRLEGDCGGDVSELDVGFSTDPPSPATSTDGRFSQAMSTFDFCGGRYVTVSRVNKPGLEEWVAGERVAGDRRLGFTQDGNTIYNTY